MAAPPPSAGTPAVQPDEPDLVRFDRAERIVHWTTAGLFVTLMLTGAALYAGPISTLSGGATLVRTIHVFAGPRAPRPAPRRAASAGGDARCGATSAGSNRWTGDDRALAPAAPVALRPVSASSTRARS